MPSPIIHAQDLSFRHPEGDFCLRVPSLQVQPKESVALTGPVAPAVRIFE